MLTIECPHCHEVMFEGKAADLPIEDDQKMCTEHISGPERLGKCDGK